MSRKRQAGQALVFAAVGMTMLLGFAGLGVDLGVLRYEKRLQQTAADAAAIAGASNLAAPSGGMSAGAQDAAATNGFTDASGGSVSSCTGSGAAVGTVCVVVNNPPSTGPHAAGTANAAKYVEVIVAEVRPTFFMKALKIDKQLVAARAVATNSSGGPSSGCLYTLGSPTSAIQGVNVQGSAVLNAPTCGIVDNGNFDPTGGALTVHAGTFGAAGDCSGSGCGKGSVTCADQAGACPQYGTPAAANPLAYLTPPCSPCTGGTSINISGNGTFNETPGTYTSISISGTGNNKTPSVVFAPGVYVLNGGNFSVTGNASISGTGVTFYFTNGATINARGGGNKLDFQLTPPTTGQYAGVLFYQDPADSTSPSLGGDDNSKFNGVVYFPGADLTFFGNAVNYSTGIVVAKALSLSGNPTVNLEGTAGLPPGATVLTIPTLVE